MKKNKKKGNIKKILNIKKPKKSKRGLSKKTKINLKSARAIKKSAKIMHISSGINGFDKISEGGFVEGSVNTIIGESGSGKTIFAMQFIMEGVKRGETCLYITFEEKKEDFYKNMLKFGWDLGKLENSGKFIFLEYSPEKIKLMLEQGGGEIESLIIEKKVKRLVIDSITSFAMLFENKILKREYIINLFDMLRAWDCTVLVTSFSNISDIKIREVSAAEFEADAIILMHFPIIKNKRERYLEILKMRGTKHPTDMYPVKIDKGISIVNKPMKIDF